MFNSEVTDNEKLRHELKKLKEENQRLKYIISYMSAMTREYADEMHWENIEMIDIENAATERYRHPALLHDLNQN